MTKKYYIWFTLVLILCLSRYNFIYANDISIDNDVQELLDDLQEEKEIERLQEAISEKEIQEAQEKVLLDESFDYSIEQYKLDKAYKIHRLSLFMLTEYQEKGSFEKVITEECRWRVPVRTTTGENGIIEFEDHNGKMEPGLESIGGEQIESLLPEEDNLIEKVKEFTNGEKIEKMVYTESILYSMTFVYFKTEKDEYLIPFTSHEDWRGLTSGKVYTAKKAIQAMSKKYDESRMINGEFRDTTGGPPVRRSANIYIITGLCFFAIVIISIIMLMILK